mmetsp:Transcript_1590/g.3473  ORF Transcript_1590/g.3473 Transcript_1590/m.3473 type:complete len:215 (+) Transcript_1590:316-960(+)
MEGGLVVVVVAVRVKGAVGAVCPRRRLRRLWRQRRGVLVHLPVVVTIVVSPMTRVIARTTPVERVLTRLLRAGIPQMLMPRIVVGLERLGRVRLLEQRIVPVSVAIPAIAVIARRSRRHAALLVRVKRVAPRDVPLGVLHGVTTQNRPGGAGRPRRVDGVVPDGVVVIGAVVVVGVLLSLPAVVTVQPAMGRRGGRVLGGLGGFEGEEFGEHHD